MHAEIKTHAMKLIKLSLDEMEKKLTRKEMKKIMAGIADCQLYGQHCDTGQAINCCTGLSCIDFKCTIKPSDQREK